MASITLHLQPTNPKFISDPQSSHNFKHPLQLRTPNHVIRQSPSVLRCKSSRSSSNDPAGGGGDEKRLDEWIQDMVKSAVKRWDDYVNSYWSSSKSEPESLELRNLGKVDNLEGEEDKIEEKNKEEWDWERWKRHFDEMEEQEMIVSMLKVQLRDCVAREDYADAAKLKSAINAAEKNDAVGSALSYLSRAIDEERYKDAVFLRDHAGVGLVGWWAGISQDSTDPYGRIIQISPEHGKFVARSYSSRQLSSARPGIPLFEIYFNLRNGEYKQQAVYLKRVSRSSRRSPKKLIKGPDAGSLNQSGGLIQEQNDVFSDDLKANGEDRDDDSDVSDGLKGIQNVLRDLMPGVKVRVMKVVAPGKVDRDLISKAIEQIIDEDDEEEESTDDELDGLDKEDVKLENGIQIDEIKSDTMESIGHAMEKQNEIPMKFVIGTLMQNMSTDLPPKDVVRVPAKLERNNRLSFLFTIEQDVKQKESSAKGQVLQKRAAALSAQQSYKAMFDLSKSLLNKETIPMNVLKDVGELVNLTMNQNQNHQSLSSSTLFHRIEIPSTLDPLGGLYIGAHGMNASEILQLKRKFGQWKEDDSDTKNTDLEFYEYVEAHKLTGSISVPAGQVAFRAKIGKQHQLPHKGIIPEEFGVIARYKGQGRIADPGFRNPRWVDGDLVILDGKLIREGPVIAFVYWAPEYHFLVFFNRLKLPE